MSRDSRAQILKKINRLKRQGKKVVFTNGCFDLVHAGHVRYLSQSRRLGDVLVVGLNSDASVRALKGKRRPILKLEERREVLTALKAVDFVIPFSEATPAALIRRVKPDVLIKGGDWQANNIVGADTVKKNGGRVVSGIHVKGRSTTAIIKAIRGR